MNDVEGDEFKVEFTQPDEFKLLPLNACKYLMLDEILLSEISGWLADCETDYLEWEKTSQAAAWRYRNGVDDEDLRSKTDKCKQPEA